MRKKTFNIYTLGCKVNQYDSGQLARVLGRKGFEPAGGNADIAIVNSCAVTKTAIIKSRRILNQARAKNPKARLVLMGCWPKAYNDEIRKVKVDLVWPVGNLNKLAGTIADLPLLKIGKQQNSKIQKPKNIKARYFLKIQDGCSQFCSYCIIPYTRGKPKSRPQRRILTEIKKAAAGGFEEIVLSGIHLGQYGKDIKKTKRKGADELLDLLKNAVKIANLGRIRLSSVEVNEISDELMKFCLRNKKICNHFHVPLQSGSNRILKKMNRPYTKEYYENKIKKIKSLDPRAAVSTDVIIGFPGETEKDFKETYNLIKSLKFSKIHIFPFSGHEKTPAFKMPDQIKREVKKYRVESLKALCEKVENEYRRSFAGHEADVIVEKEKIDDLDSGQKVFFSKTEHYLNVIFKKNDIIEYYGKKNKNCLIGRMVKIKL